MKVLKVYFIFFVGFFICNYVKADTVSWQAPRVYSLNLEGPNVLESNSIPAEGIITSVTVNWDFSGKVRLEISANNGKDYTPIINGVPLSKGFIPGNQLRFKAFLEPRSKLNKVVIFYTDTSGLTYTFGNPQLSGFKFRKAIDILNPSGAELFNYQLKIELIEAGLMVARNTPHVESKIFCDGHIEADFKDIRFTTSDGETPLAYYLESISRKKPNRIATFWVKLPQLPKEENPIHIFLYYGNKDAEDRSSADNVFDFFDDFSEKELNTEKWEASNELEGVENIEHGQLKLMNSKIVSRNFKFQDGIIEFKASIKGPCALQGIIREKKNDHLRSPINQTVYSSRFSGAEHTIAVGDMVKVNIGNPISENEDYVYRVTAEGLNLNFERYNFKSINKEAELYFIDIGGLAEGYIGCKGECVSGNNEAVYFDWIRVREYSKMVPRILFVDKEEKINLSQFSEMDLSKEGRLILKNNQNYGRYESIVIPITYSSRIIKIMSNLPLSISSDGGKTYKTNAQSAKYYYASNGDFNAGSAIKWQLGSEDSSVYVTGKKLQVKELERVSIDYYPGKMTVVWPNGGEELMDGSLKEILWSAEEYETRFLLKLEYSLDRGKTYKTIVEQTPNTGSFYWRIPDGISSQEALIKVSDTKSPEVYDTSDGCFNIISR